MVGGGRHYLARAGRHRPLKRLTVCFCWVAVLCVPLAARGQGGFDQPSKPEAVSFFGDTLRTPPLREAEFRGRQMQMMKAENRWKKNPKDLDLLIWAGRRLAYLGRFQEAIEVYTQGIDLYPKEPRLYRHRGHRFITVRLLDAAIRDLATAKELMAGKPIQGEEDGFIHENDMPLTSLQSNVWYYLGLAYYLKGDWDRAEAAFRSDLALAANDDSKVSASYWLYLTLQRAGRDVEAAAILKPIQEKMTLLENENYHELLMLFKGERDLDHFQNKLTTDDMQGATLAYGLSCALEFAGRPKEAEARRRKILEMSAWDAFGYIAAEADLHRRESHR